MVAGASTARTVRDYCDEPEDGPDDVGPDWPGTTRCDGSLGVRSNGSLSARTSSAAGSLLLRGPRVRQPAEAVRPQRPQRPARRRRRRPAVAAREGRHLVRAVTAAVGTTHPAPDVHYQGTRTCSAFPHIYDGIVYLYDCEDTLVWDGKVTIERVLP